MITRGRVRVTLTRAHVDTQGFPTRAAVGHLWAAVASLPAGAAVVLDLGPARYVNHTLLAVCREHLTSCELIIEGRDPDVVRGYLAAAREGVS